MKDNTPTLRDIPLIILTFILVLIPWTFFRVDFDTAIYILGKIATDFSILSIDMLYPKRLLLVAAFIVIEWLARRKEYPLQIGFLPAWLRYAIYLFIIAVIFMFGEFGYTPFIYFQF